MSMTKLVLGGILSLAVICGGVAVAQMPKDNGATRPNVVAAQHLCQQAWEKITTAQRANEWDMQGHAAKAKELLDQANRELKLAAEAANK
jgi:hypothetical protein